MGIGECLSFFRPPSHLPYAHELPHLRSHFTTRHSPIPSILQIAKQNKIITLPEYILSNTDGTHWHTKRVVLIGDAAHIFQPHTGQGVSQTLEDVACLTAVLKGLMRGEEGRGEVKAEELEKAFRTFEERRRPRV